MTETDTPTPDATACRSCGSYEATRPDGYCDGCGSAIDQGASEADAYSWPADGGEGEA